MLSVIIPANNEEGWIEGCLAALAAQQDARPAEVIVAANGCTDRTVPIARGFGGAFETQGWRLRVLDIAEGNKANALNTADREAEGAERLYLDADIVCSPDLIGKAQAALDRPEPTYAGARLIVAPAKTWTTRRYGALWSRLPFMTASGATGAGLFAVNGPGRARWDTFPPIIADDTFARLQFEPHERVALDATYTWPMVEGFRALVKVRRRQDAGMAEIAEHYPGILEREGKPPVRAADHLRLALGHPVDYAVYCAVAVAVRLGPQTRAWNRGR